MENNITVLNMSGIYDLEAFYKDVPGLDFVDLKDIPGTNCMCDDVAKEKLAAAIGSEGTDGAGQNNPAHGLHFIDNGNYHYISALYLSFVKDSFSLVVMDHHPDMQAPMFDILSCGGWILHVIENNPYVRDIHIIGADPGLISQLDEKTRERVKFYDPEEVFGEAGNNGSGAREMTLPVTDHPVYLSIDKDVISRDELITNWDQGELTAEQVLGFMKALFQREESESGRGIIGIDICGECVPEQEDCDMEAAIAGNEGFNRKVLQYFVR